MSAFALCGYLAAYGAVLALLLAVIVLHPEREERDR